MQYPTPLAEAVSKQGLRRDWVAKQLGVHKSTVTRWCDGEVVPDEATQKSLALLLRRSVAELFPASTEAAA